MELDLFNTKINRSVRFEEFKQLQDAESNSVKEYLKNVWITELIGFIRNRFQEIEKGWFNIKESKQNNYDYGKLKRFLTMVRLNMQDSVLHLCMKNYENYKNWIKSFVPLSIEIIETNKVNNIFPKTDEGKENPQPLFAIDLLKSTSNDEFLYSTPPKNFLTSIMTHFDRIFEDLSRIPDIEQKVLSEVYKTHQRIETFIKTPVRPSEKPIIDANDMPIKRFTTDNHWIWWIYEDLKENLEKGIAPLYEYIKKFDRYKHILAINPIEYTEKMDTEEAPKEINEIRDEILELQNKEKQLRELIPESIQVSFFQVHCKDLLLFLGSKYINTIKNLKDLIGKRAKNKTQKIWENINKIHSKIKETPKDIESLTEIKEFMAGVPSKKKKYYTLFI